MRQSAGRVICSVPVVVVPSVYVPPDLALKVPEMFKVPVTCAVLQVSPNKACMSN
jgi:hypothetical protein